MTNKHRMGTIRLTSAQALVKYLSVQYSERDGNQRRLIPAIFGIFGHGNVAGLGQALYEYGGDLPYYQAHNEQSMVHTASGFAKASCRLASLACAASIGPGSTNMVTGAALATINRLPVLLLPADYYASRHQGSVLQQLEHPVSADVSVNDCFRPVSRFFDRIMRPEQLLTALPEAMRVLTDVEEVGAVTLALPQDVQMEAYDYPLHFFKKKVWRVGRPMPDPELISESISLLKRAKRPVIIAGGGAVYSEASEELREFSERCGIPVGETFAGKGAVPNDSQLLMGGVGVTGSPIAAKIVDNADLVFCLGTRLTDFTTGSRTIFSNPDVRFVSVNVSSQDGHKLGGLSLVSDVRETLRALSAAATKSGIKPRKDYLREVADMKNLWAKQVRDQVYQSAPKEKMTQGFLIGVLNEESEAGDTIVAAAGSPPADLHKLWEVSRGAACHLEFGYSCMGYEIPAALGVRMARPQCEVYVLIGDGTYLMNPTDLVTAIQEKLKVTVVISENHGYQCIRQLQMERVGYSFGNEFRSRDPKTNRLEGNYISIDFAKNAESLGARAWQVMTPHELRKALREAREEKRCCVIVAETQMYNCTPNSGVWWDVGTAEVSGDPTILKRRVEYERRRDSLRRFYY